MNIIHSTFKNENTVYTVIGDLTLQDSNNNPALIVLSRGGAPFRKDYFEELHRLCFSEILSIEINKIHTDLEELSSSYNRLRFVNIPKVISVGEALNIAFLEIKAPYALVVWNDLQIRPHLMTDKIFDRLIKHKELCMVPQLFNSKEELLPSFVAPANYKKQLKTLFLTPGGNDFSTLYPFDYIGLYNKDDYIELGGFDVRFANSYWQRMDFGFRAYMWGKSIRWGRELRFSYMEDSFQEDTTLDQEYKLFYLKNLAVSYQGDHGIIHMNNLLPFLFGLKGQLYHDWQLFMNTRKWVELYKYRFMRDSRNVVELWGANNE
ncbi:hypothetical protein [Spirochaeta cellobiosiphila]|uniref:hypothetical protein n=1 Tax=Spirochaeta cellobiosiphila TaxID=504483 RepID=UPI00040857DA|nr:hypothetical protein [Spirochaeta cellobiosiphila]